jgi:hypothetical protein
MQEKPTQVTKSFLLHSRDVQVIDNLAQRRFDQNQSMAMRAIIQHYRECEYPTADIAPCGDDEPGNGNTPA